jgi:hypothetical protein
MKKDDSCGNPAEKFHIAKKKTVPLLRKPIMEDYLFHYRSV